MPRTLTYHDLPVSPRAGEMLKYAICDGEYSATQGDYFMAHPDDTSMCCDEPLTLVRRVTRLEPLVLPSQHDSDTSKGGC